MRKQAVKRMENRDLMLLRREFSAGDCIEDVDYITYILTKRSAK